MRSVSVPTRYGGRVKRQVDKERWKFRAFGHNRRFLFWSLSFLDFIFKILSVFFFFFMKKIFNRNITQIVCSFPHQPQLFFSHLPTSLIYLINVVWTVPNTHGVGIAMVNTQQRRYVICWTWLVPVVQSKSIIKKLIFFVKIIIY